MLPHVQRRAGSERRRRRSTQVAEAIWCYKPNAFRAVQQRALCVIPASGGGRRFVARELEHGCVVRQATTCICIWHVDDVCFSVLSYAGAGHSRSLEGLESSEALQGQGQTRESLSTLMMQCRAEKVVLRVCTLVLNAELVKIEPYCAEGQEDYLRRCRGAMSELGRRRCVILVAHPGIIQRARRAVEACDSDTMVVLMFPSKAMATLNSTRLGGMLADSLVLEFERSKTICEDDSACTSATGE